MRGVGGHVGGPDTRDPPTGEERGQVRHAIVILTEVARARRRVEGAQIRLRLLPPHLVGPRHDRSPGRHAALPFLQESARLALVGQPRVLPHAPAVGAIDDHPPAADVPAVQAWLKYAPHGQAPSLAVVGPSRGTLLIAHSSYL